MFRSSISFKAAAILSVVASVAVAFAMSVAEPASSQQRREARTGTGEAVQEKQYVATRRIVFDKETRTLRFPDAQELDTLVANLKRMTDRSTDGLKRFPLAGGGEGVDLDGRFAGVFLARPRPDGSSEVKCVFSFEEASSFLGIEEKVSDR